MYNSKKTQAGHMNKRISRRIIQELKDRTLGIQVSFKATAYTLVNKRLPKALTSEPPNHLTIATLLQTLPITHRSPFDEMVQTCINTTLQTEKTFLFDLLKQNPTDEEKTTHTKQVIAFINDYPLLVFAIDDYRFTPLHRASIKGHEEIVILLINKGADVNATTKIGITPLHVAALYGHKATVKAVLEDGAEVNATVTDGEYKDFTPLQLTNNYDMKALLRKAGART